MASPDPADDLSWSQRVNSIVDDPEIEKIAEQVEEVLASASGGAGEKIPETLLALARVGMRLNHDLYLRDPEFREHVDDIFDGAKNGAFKGGRNVVRQFAMFHAAMMIAEADLLTTEIEVKVRHER